MDNSDNRVQTYYPPGLIGQYGQGQPNGKPYLRRHRSQLVCYQCGVVGHLRYECHLLPTSAYQPRNQFNSRGQEVNRQLRTYPEQSAQTELQSGPANRQGNTNMVNPQSQQASGFPRNVPESSVQRNSGQAQYQNLFTLNGMVIEVVCQKVNLSLSAIPAGGDLEILTEGSKAANKREVIAREFVRELISGNEPMESKMSGTEQEVMAGEKARLRSQLTESSSAREKEPPAQKQRRETDQDSMQGSSQRRISRKKNIHRPIRLMAGRPGFDFVAGFRDTQVTGLTSGQFFDLSPEGKRQFVRLIV